MKHNYFLLLISVCTIMGCTEKQEINYHENGIISFKVPLRNGQREGKSFQYYPSGEIHIISHWKKGEKNGVSIMYYEGGVKRAEGMYIDNLAQGEHYYYDENGNLTEIISFNNDKMHGDYEEFFPDGTLKVTGKYLNDLPHGACFSYYRDGKVHQENLYNEGELLLLKEFDSLGNLLGKFIPVDLKKIDSNIIRFELLYSEYEHVNVEWMSVNFDDEGFVKDTVEIIRSDSSTLLYNLAPGQDKISGVFLEIKMPENIYDGEIHFIDYDIENID